MFTVSSINDEFKAFIIDEVEVEVDVDVCGVFIITGSILL